MIYKYIPVIPAYTDNKPQKPSHRLEELLYDVARASSLLGSLVYNNTEASRIAFRVSTVRRREQRADS